MWCVHACDEVCLCMHAYKHVGAHVCHLYACTCMCDIHLSHVQLLLCLLQFRGRLLSLVFHLHQEVILVLSVGVQT